MLLIELRFLMFPLKFEGWFVSSEEGEVRENMEAIEEKL